MNLQLKLLITFGVAILLAGCNKGEKRVVASYDNGKPATVYYIKKQDGKEIKTYQENYYINGKKRMEGAFDNDKRTGVWTYYYDNGEKFAQADFSEVKEGKAWQVWLDKDSLLVNKSDGLLSIAFSDEGTPVSIRIKRDNQEIFYRFFNSFKIMERVFMRGNIPQGEAVAWYENGNMNSVHYYKDGNQDSVYTVYSEQGNAIIKGQYINGKRTGKWEYFSSEGKPLGIEVYDSAGEVVIPRQDPNIVTYTKSDLNN